MLTKIVFLPVTLPLPSRLATIGDRSPNPAPTGCVPLHVTLSFSFSLLSFSRSLYIFVPSLPFRPYVRRLMYSSNYCVDIFIFQTLTQITQTVGSRQRPVELNQADTLLVAQYAMSAHCHRFLLCSKSAPLSLSGCVCHVASLPPYVHFSLTSWLGIIRCQGDGFKRCHGQD